ncbi:MAG TPA: hypothetical protein DF427_07980 [Moraxellaceae bacterium]|nr:hypothetical protein [Moraxellaceae bacterium]
MFFIPNISSLNLVKAEVDATLAQIEAQVGSYVEERENTAVLATCVEEMDQVYGALRLIELPGALELAGVMSQLMRQVQANGADAADEAFAALGQGIMVLGRYLEYVQIKEGAWPQLLLPAINQVRAALGQNPLSEGYFLHVSELPAAPAVTQLDVTPAQLNALVRRLRLMYQTALIAVLRDQADVPHLRMMIRACERAQQVCGQRPQALLWWVGAAMIEALQHGASISPARKALLGQLDRQLKALAVNDGGGNPDPRLLSDCLYVVGLVLKGDHVTPVRAAFSLDSCSLTEEGVTAEYELMCGPGGSVIKTVASVLKDELALIKDTLDLMSRGAKNDSESYQTMADTLNRTSQTLVMLGLLDASQKMRAQADDVRGWQGEPAVSELHALVDALMDVENAVAGLVKQVTPGADTAVTNSRISVHQLDEARGLLVAESRSGLSLAKRGISSYLESERDLLHLANVPSTLQSVAGGLSFLMIERGAEVLRSCARFIDSRMLVADTQPSMADLETLADAISSVDYFLESLEANKPIGDSILEIAEDSVAELGFPVGRSQAA